MRRKKWDSKTKWLIVLEGFKGRAVAEIRAEYGITQSHYYQWRDRFLSAGHKVFDQTKEDQKQVYLEKENTKLKKLIEELTYELKKQRSFYSTRKINIKLRNC
jgi:hypothetical protein